MDSLGDLINTSPLTMNFSIIPDSISLLGALGWIVAVCVYLFHRARKEADEHEAKLIATMQTRLALLEKSDKEKEAQIQKLLAENSVLKDLILQRDPEDKDFRDKVVTALAQIDALYTAHLQGGQ